MRTMRASDPSESTEAGADVCLRKKGYRDPDKKTASIATWNMGWLEDLIIVSFWGQFRPIFRGGALAVNLRECYLVGNGWVVFSETKGFFMAPFKFWLKNEVVFSKLPVILVTLHSTWVVTIWTFHPRLLNYDLYKVISIVFLFVHYHVYCCITMYLFYLYSESHTSFFFSFLFEAQ